MPAAPLAVLAAAAGSAPAVPGGVMGASPVVPTIAALAAAMIAAVDARLSIAAPPSASMKLFTGLTPTYTGETFTPNSACWLHELRAQLTGISMRSGGYLQSYGMIPLGDRFLLNCAHNGPEPLPVELKYVKADGTVFTTTATHWINDRVGAYSSDTQQAYQTDLMIYVTAAALPAWVYRAPILSLDSSQRAALGAYDPPTVAISQGGWTSGPATPYGYADTPYCRMVYAKSLQLAARTALRDPFFHAAWTGDSGTPEYILAADVLYFYRLITSSSGDGYFVSDWINYINSLIARGATAAGIAPITIAAVPLCNITL